jgi:hypothetical protein
MLAAVALASLALVCHGQHAPLTPEQKRQGELEYYADARASFGLRSDIPYIREQFGPAVKTVRVGTRHECLAE